MPKGTNQKLKLSILTRIMLQKTDENHKLTLPEIVAELERYDITAERKSIYSDFEDMLNVLNIDVIKEQVGRKTYYYVGSREFELAEVKLIIDAIQASKFITDKKTKSLIDKMKSLVSEHQAKQLQRQIYISDRQNENENVYYNVDCIHNAINNNRKIEFKYYTWDINKNFVPRRNGKNYGVSPWLLTWCDENYYLVAYDDSENKIKHYRVDKMKNITVEKEPRGGAEEFQKYDMGSYSKMNFGMFGGDKAKVRIEFPNDKCGIFIDRFGKDITLFPVDEGHKSIAVDVFVSPQFMGWIFGLGPDVKVTSPADVVDKMREAAGAFAANYA